MNMQHKKYAKVVTEITELTPEKAKTLLDSQFKGVAQRKVSSRHVFRYTDAIKRGLWMFDAMPIRIDWFGRMFDGQHRCLAVVKAQQSMKVLIVYGLSPDVYQVCDRGKARSYGDALRRNGELYYNELASAIILLSIYRSGITSYSGGAAVSKPCQTQDILKMLEDSPGLRTSAKKIQSARVILAPSIATFLHYIFSEKHSQKADMFFEKLGSGEGFKKKDPIRVLRDRLTFNKMEAVKMERKYKIAIAIKAWNVFCEDGELTNLVWRSAKKPKEIFPVVK